MASKKQYTYVKHKDTGKISRECKYLGICLVVEDGHILSNKKEWEEQQKEEE